MTPAPARVPFSGAALLDTAEGAVLVVRDPRCGVAALTRGWESRAFALEVQPEGWWGEPWSFELVDGWQDLIGKPLTQVCAFQWLTLMLRELSARPDALLVRAEDLVADPRLAEEELSKRLSSPVSVKASGPGDAWAMDFDAAEVTAGLNANGELLELYLDLVESRGTKGYRDPLPERAVESVDERRPSTGTVFSSSFTGSVPALLAAARSSLLITTYKAGQVILARTEDGKALDTNFTKIDRPMGTAVAGNRLAVGGVDSVVVYMRHDAGTESGLLPVPDAVFVPKVVSFTGDVAVHDMGWDGEGRLWFGNTRFSCLSVLEPYSSFTCAWKPSWISNLAAEDRCHLNGLAMVDGQPRFATALAMTDQAGGWREHRGTGGVVVDITTNEVVASGLSMPHSPRWHEGALWFLQSGTGTLNRLEADGGITHIATLPGFTRGLAFLGHYALVGLSQVRESVFADLPVTASAAERNCGVWIVDTRDGSTAGFLRFSGAVTEIFDVQIIPARWPHIAEAGHLTRTSFSLDPDTLSLIASAAQVKEGRPA